MTHFFTYGTAGDAFITSLKLRSIPEAVSVSHFTEHTYWHGLLLQLLSLAPNIREVGFVQAGLKEFRDLPSPKVYPTFTPPEAEPDPAPIEAVYYPEWEAPRRDLPDSYLALSCHAGKPAGKGRNTKIVPPGEIAAILRESPLPVVLLGTDDSFLPGSADTAINLVGETTPIEALRIAAGASAFTGPEGLLAFAALSGRVYSFVMYTAEEAVNCRIRCGPWDRHCRLAACRAPSPDFLLRPATSA